MSYKLPNAHFETISEFPKVTNRPFVQNIARRSAIMGAINAHYQIGNEEGTMRAIKTTLGAAIFAGCFLLSIDRADAVTVIDNVTTVNFETETVNFQITFASAPDFSSTNLNPSGPPSNVLRQADSFQYYIGVYGSPIVSFGVPNFQTVIRGGEIYLGGGIPIREGISQTPVLPGSGGWGPVRGVVPFTLNNNVLEFVVSFAVLNEPTGIFPYVLDVFEFGGTMQSFHVFSSDGTLPPVPLPAALPLFATGLGALGLLAWRRKAGRREGKSHDRTL